MTESMWVAIKVRSWDRYAWQPALEESFATLPLPMWFDSEAACLDYIDKNVLGAKAACEYCGEGANRGIICDNCWSDSQADHDLAGMG